MSNKRETKLHKVFTDLVSEEPTFLVAYQTERDNNTNNSEVIREKIHVINLGSKHRYYGKTPIVFVRREHENNIEVLNLANTIKISLENETLVKYERDIKNTIKTVLKANNVDSQTKKSVYNDVYGEIMLKRPHKDFITFTNGMFRKVSQDIVTSVIESEEAKKS